MATNTLFCKAIFPPMYLVDDTKFLNKNDVNKQISCVKRLLYASSHTQKKEGGEGSGRCYDQTVI